ncbi:MAG: site-2 protease family protein [Treponema sp.]|jgi:regulator of sigma E protease|nr:site-2 protease family protein [Treponema sp.]
MFIAKILLGLIGLGLVVFVHELGHFLAARLVGIDVEAFSIGWGRPILKRKFRGVEYRLGMFPLGGYCKMRGENEFQEAWENRRKEIPPVPGTFFGANPFRRILVAFAGPFFNFLFAVLVLSVIWGAGFEVNTLGNRIILASELGEADQNYPANQAGLETGDRIISINGVDTPYYHDIQENIAVNPEKNLALKVERDGTILDLTVRPSLEKSTGAGKIGVYFWTDPVLSGATGPARAAGLMPGDRILKVNGEDLPYTVKMLSILEDKPQSLNVEYERNGEKAGAVLIPIYQEGGVDLGLSYGVVTYKNPVLLPPAALAKGARETWKTLVVSLKSLVLLFRGIDLTQAVSGPVRITYMAGDIATEAFGQGIGTGFRSMANFLSLISIALCVMNLLPLPVLDGGMILLCVVELIRRKPLHPRAVSAFQTVGVVLIFGLMIFAVFGDILYLVRH